MSGENLDNADLIPQRVDWNIELVELTKPDNQIAEAYLSTARRLRDVLRNVASLPNRDEQTRAIQIVARAAFQDLISMMQGKNPELMELLVGDAGSVAEYRFSIGDWQSTLGTLFDRLELVLLKVFPSPLAEKVKAKNLFYFSCLSKGLAQGLLDIINAASATGIEPGPNLMGIASTFTTEAGRDAIVSLDLVDELIRRYDQGDWEGISIVIGDEVINEGRTMKSVILRLYNELAGREGNHQRAYDLIQKLVLFVGIDVFEFKPSMSQGQLRWVERGGRVEVLVSIARE